MSRLDAIFEAINDTFCWMFGIERQQPSHLYVRVEEEQRGRRRR